MKDEAKANGAVAQYREIVDAALKTHMDKLRDQTNSIQAVFREAQLKLVPEPYHGWDFWPGWKFDNRHFWGLLVFAMLLSLGAPFWFNALKILTNLKPLLASRWEKESSRLEKPARRLSQLLAFYQSGQALFSMLQGLAAAAGKPTRITYVTGNHDRVLNNFDVLRQRIAAALLGVPVHFSTELLAPEYGVLARHGHQWDDNCHGWKLYTDVLRKGPVGRFVPEAHRVMAIASLSPPNSWRV